MAVNETKIDYLGEIIGLDDLIKRIEEMVRTETSLSDPWFIGESVYPHGDMLFTIPCRTFGDLVGMVTEYCQLSSVTNSSGGLRFLFTGYPELEYFSYLASGFYVYAVSADVAKEFKRVAAKYEKYDRIDILCSDSLRDRFTKELYATLEGATHLGYRG